MKILITGGSGTLGKELIRLLESTNHDIQYPTSSEMNVIDEKQVTKTISEVKPDLVIHSAAYTDVRGAENNIEDALDVNVVGTCNIVKACSLNKTRLAFISSDYVFDGENGPYKTTDPINPLTKYAKSKGASELVARMYERTLTIRTSFFKHTFPYEKAFDDQWSSKDYIDIIAPNILEKCLSEDIGIVHCGSRRRTIFDIAKDRKPDIKRMSRKDINFTTPKDTSLL